MFLVLRKVGNSCFEHFGSFEDRAAAIDRAHDIALEHPEPIYVAEIRKAYQQKKTDVTIVELEDLAE